MPQNQKIQNKTRAQSNHIKNFIKNSPPRHTSSHRRSDFASKAFFFPLLFFFLIARIFFCFVSLSHFMSFPSFFFLKKNKVYHCYKIFFFATLRGSITHGVSVPASQRRLHYQLHFFFLASIPFPRGDGIHSLFQNFLFYLVHFLQAKKKRITPLPTSQVFVIHSSPRFFFCIQLMVCYHCHGSFPFVTALRGVRFPMECKCLPHQRCFALLTSLFL